MNSTISVLIGITTLVFLLFLNIRKKKERHKDGDAHTEVKIKRCCHFNFICMQLVPASLRGGYRP